MGNVADRWFHGTNLSDVIQKSAPRTSGCTRHEEHLMNGIQPVPRHTSRTPPRPRARIYELIGAKKPLPAARKYLYLAFGVLIYASQPVISSSRLFTDPMNHHRCSPIYSPDYRRSCRHSRIKTAIVANRRTLALVGTNFRQRALPGRSLGWSNQMYSAR